MDELVKKDEQVIEYTETHQQSVAPSTGLPAANPITLPQVEAANNGEAGQQPEAQKYMQEAMRLGTQDALFFYHAGMIAYRSGDMATARARLAQALTVNPYFSPIYASQARTTLAQAAK